LLRFDRAAYTHLSEQASSAFVCTVGLTWRAVDQRRQAEHFYLPEPADISICDLQIEAAVDKTPEQV
jgi:hypothetical protein